MVQEKLLEGRLVVKVGDITEEGVDAIVNAANSTLLGGGGVDGAIHRKGGPQILLECKRICETAYPHGLPTGQAVITTGGDLKARYVIHTVGPIYGKDKEREAELLANAYKNSLRVAKENGIASIAFPSISTGAYGYPKREAAKIAFAAVAEALANTDLITEVRMVFYSEQDAAVFLEQNRS